MSTREQVESLKGIPSSDGEPVFTSPWQAKTFAMTLQLYQSGAFTWVEWAEELSQNIAEYERKESVNNTDDYYAIWQASLEGILLKKGLINT